MSSETYGLLKRPDEFFIVNKAHHNPKFVEDVVRGILARALDVYADFPDTTYIGATQVNDESIHKHDAFAEAFGLFGEFRRELREGGPRGSENRSRYLARHATFAGRNGVKVRVLFAIVLFALAGFAVPAAAATCPAPADGTYVEPSFTFADGETMKNLRLHYVTL